jgi:hypothetical protein
MADIEVDASKLNLRLDKLAPAVHDALLVAVTLDAGELQGRAVSKASGDLLQVRSGKFVKSIKVSVRQSATRVTGRVYSRDPRAGLFEYGGTTRPHEIVAKNAHALLLQMRGGTRFAAKVQHPGGKYAARDIIHSAFDEMKGDIAGDLTDAVRSALP